MSQSTDLGILLSNKLNNVRAHAEYVVSWIAWLMAVAVIVLAAGAVLRELHMAIPYWPVGNPATLIYVAGILFLLNRR